MKSRTLWCFLFPMLACSVDFDDDVTGLTALLTDTVGESSGSTGSTSDSASESASRPGSTSDPDRGSTSDGSTSDGSNDAETTGSTGSDTVPSRVTWEDLLDQAVTEAQAAEPDARLNMVFARGVQADGTVALGAPDSEPELSFWFADVSVDAGAIVRFDADSYIPETMSYEPSVTQTSGNGLVWMPIPDLSSVPTFAEIAHRIADTPQWTAFGGTPDDKATVRLQPFLEHFVEVSVSTASGTTTADAASPAVPPCA